MKSLKLRYRLHFLSAFLLVGFLSFGETLYIAATELYREEIRSEMRAEISSIDEADLEEASLVQIVVDAAHPAAGTLVDMEEREIEVDGAMYDIVRSETRQNITTYYCKADGLESLLNAHVRQDAKQRSRTRHQNWTGNTLIAKLCPQHPFSSSALPCELLHPSPEPVFSPSLAPDYSPPPPRIS